MTKIYIYCLFDISDQLLGVYSSIKAVHRDALRHTNRGHGSVHIVTENNAQVATLTGLRNIFKGKCDCDVKYRTQNTLVRIYKTKLKE